MSNGKQCAADAEYQSWTANIESARRGPRIPHLTLEDALKNAGLDKYLVDKTLLDITGEMYGAVIRSEHNASKNPSDFRLLMAAKNAMNSTVVDSRQFGHRLDVHRAFGSGDFYYAVLELHHAMVAACQHAAPEGSHPHMESRYVAPGKPQECVFYRYPGTEVDVEPKKFWEQYRKDIHAWSNVICEHMQKALGSHVARGS